MGTFESLNLLLEIPKSVFADSSRNHKHACPSAMFTDKIVKNQTYNLAPHEKVSHFGLIGNFADENDFDFFSFP